MSSPNDIPEFEPIRHALARPVGEPPAFREEWFEMSPSVVVLDPGMRRRRVVPVAAAAAAVLVAGLGLFLYREADRQKPAEPVAAKSNAVVVVLLARGPVRAIRGDQTLALNAGSTLQSHDTISADADAETDLLLPDQSIVRLRGEGSLTLSDIDGRIRLMQSNGTTYHDVAPSALRKGYEVQTPTAIAGVRGTRFEVTATPGATTIHVTQGTVEVSPPDGAPEFEPTVLEPGEIAVTAADSADGSARIEKKNASQPENLVIYTAMDRNRDELGSDLLGQIAGMKNTSDQGEIEKIYNRPLETLVLSDGTILKGVVASQAGNRLILHTTRGIVIVPVENLQEIQYQK